MYATQRSGSIYKGGVKFGVLSHSTTIMCGLTWLRSMLAPHAGHLMPSFALRGRENTVNDVVSHTHINTD